ncbi:thioredoxin, partial [Staphylococcus epidermidis]|uniref:thioredoxin n=1 Tax=Staphylococcus epidermidis TaxID=1282 RepID=UPI0011A1F09C
THPLPLLHIITHNSTLSHPLLPQIQHLLNHYPKPQLPVINQSNLQPIPPELSIFTLPLHLIFFKRKEIHTQPRFIDMQSFQ